MVDPNEEMRLRLTAQSIASRVMLGAPPAPNSNNYLTWASDLATLAAYIALREPLSQPRYSTIPEETVEVAEALEEVLRYEGMKSSNPQAHNGWGDCTCINWSRAFERRYEAGRCPHQRARAALSVLQAREGGE